MKDDCGNLFKTEPEHELELCQYFYESTCKPEKCWITAKQIMKAKEILKFWGWFSYRKDEEIPIVIP